MKQSSIFAKVSLNHLRLGKEGSNHPRQGKLDF